VRLPSNIAGLEAFSLTNSNDHEDTKNNDQIDVDKVFK